MLFGLNNKQVSLVATSTFISLIMALALIQSAQANNTRANSIKKQTHSKFYLVPPPPPYVPSMLPELARYHGYGQSYYSNSTRQAGNSPIVYKPNKYITYYFPNKG